MIYNRPVDLPYAGNVTTHKNGYIVSGEAAELEHKCATASAFMQAYKDITDGDGTEPAGEWPLVKQTPQQLVLLLAAQDLCGDVLDITSRHPNIKPSDELVNLISELLNIKGDDETDNGPQATSPAPNASRRPSAQAGTSGDAVASASHAGTSGDAVASASHAGTSGDAVVSATQAGTNGDAVASDSASVPATGSRAPVGSARSAAQAGNSAGIASAPATSSGVSVDSARSAAQAGTSAGPAVRTRTPVPSTRPPVSARNAGVTGTPVPSTRPPVSARNAGVTGTPVPSTRPSVPARNAGVTGTLPISNYFSRTNPAGSVISSTGAAGVGVGMSARPTPRTSQRLRGLSYDPPTRKAARAASGSTTTSVFPALPPASSTVSVFGPPPGLGGFQQGRPTREVAQAASGSTTTSVSSVLPPASSAAGVFGPPPGLGGFPQGPLTREAAQAASGSTTTSVSSVLPPASSAAGVFGPPPGLGGFPQGPLTREAAQAASGSTTTSVSPAHPFASSAAGVFGPPPGLGVPRTTNSSTPSGTDGAGNIAGGGVTPSGPAGPQSPGSSGPPSGLVRPLSPVYKPGIAGPSSPVRALGNVRTPPQGVPHTIHGITESTPGFTGTAETSDGDITIVTRGANSSGNISSDTISGDMEQSDDDIFAGMRHIANDRNLSLAKRNRLADGDMEQSDDDIFAGMRRIANDSNSGAAKRNRPADGDITIFTRGADSSGNISSDTISGDMEQSDDDIFAGMRRITNDRNSGPAKRHRPADAVADGGGLSRLDSHDAVGEGLLSDAHYSDSQLEDLDFDSHEEADAAQPSDPDDDGEPGDGEWSDGDETDEHMPANSPDGDGEPGDGDETDEHMPANSPDGDGEWSDGDETDERMSANIPDDDDESSDGESSDSDQGEDDGDHAPMPANSPYNVYRLATPIMELLKELVEQFRSALLPQIEPPTDHLMMSSPFFLGAFEKHLAWHRYLEQVDPKKMVTDFELWWIRAQIKKCYENADPRVAKAALTAPLRLARDQKIPLGKEPIILYESNRIVRYKREAKWAAEPQMNQPVRDDFPTVFYRAMVQQKISLGQADEAKALLKDAHMVVLLGPVFFSVETQEEHQDRSSAENNFRRSATRTPEQRRAHRRMRYLKVRQDPVQWKRTLERDRKYNTKWLQDHGRLDTRRTQARYRHHLNKVDKLVVRVNAQLAEIAETDTVLEERLQLAVAGREEGRRVDAWVHQLFPREKRAIFATEECQRVGAAAHQALLDAAVAEECPQDCSDADKESVINDYAKRAGTASWNATRKYAFDLLARTRPVPNNFVTPQPLLRLEAALLSGEMRVKLAGGSAKRIDQLQIGDCIMVNGISHRLEALPEAVMSTTYAFGGGLSLIDEDWLNDNDFTCLSSGRSIQVRQPVRWQWSSEQAWTEGPDPFRLLLKTMPNDIRQRAAQDPTYEMMIIGTKLRIIGKHIADGSYRQPIFSTGRTDSEDVGDYREIAQILGLHCEMIITDQSLPPVLKEITDKSRLGKRIQLCCQDKFHKQLYKQLELERFAPVFKECTVRLFEGAHTPRLGRNICDGHLWQSLRELKIPGFKKFVSNPARGEGLAKFLKLCLDHPCKDYTRCVLAGMIDGDGSVDSNGTVSFATSFSNVADFMVRGAKNVGINLGPPRIYNQSGKKMIRGANCDVLPTRVFRFPKCPATTQLIHFCGVVRKSSRIPKKVGLQLMENQPPKAFYRFPIASERLRTVTLADGTALPVAVVRSTEPPVANASE